MARLCRVCLDCDGKGFHQVREVSTFLVYVLERHQILFYISLLSGISRCEGCTACSIFSSCRADVDTNTAAGDTIRALLIGSPSDTAVFGLQNRRGESRDPKTSLSTCWRRSKRYYTPDGVPHGVSLPSIRRNQTGQNSDILHFTFPLRKILI